MRILVTGAAGFLGYHTSLGLTRQPYEVVLTDNFARHRRDEAFEQVLKRSRVTFYELNLLDPARWSALGGGYDAVLHFAAINGTRHFYERPYEVLEHNIELLRHMLAWHRDFSPGAHIVWPSSPEVYAGVPGVEMPTPETTPVGVADVFNPRCSYAVSKLAGELLLINYARGRGLRYTIVRPHNIYGPRMGNDHVIPQLVLRIRQRQDPFLLYGAEETRSFCYVENFVEGVLAIFGAPEADGNIINLGDDRQEIRIRDLAERLFGVARWHPRTVEVRPAPAGSAVRRRPALDKARRLLHYQPAVDLDEGLRRTYAWYKEQ